MNRREEVESKLQLVRGWLERTGGAAVLLGSQSNFAWITAGGHSHIALGEESGVALVLVTTSDAYLLTTNIELQRLLDEEVPDESFTTVEYPWHDQQAPERLVTELCDTSQAISDLGAMGLPRAPEDIVELRRVLLEPELDRYRALGRAAGKALETACREAALGDTELDVAARLSFECLKEGVLPLVNLVAADDRIARYRHPLPTRNALSGTLLAAVTGRRHGLHASATRMVTFGAVDDDLEARRRSVARVDARFILASTPGRSLGEVLDDGIREYASEAFQDDWKLHHQGGLTGYAGREVLATPGSTYGLKANQALAWNPSITRVKSEDTILVTDDDHEVITRTGEWPEEEVEIDNRTVVRPAFLKR